jgi:hypothetical protein
MYRIRMGPANATVLENLPPGRESAVWQLETRDGFAQITGRLLGVATSQRPTHSHATYDRALTENRTPGLPTRCAACRWSEIYIFRVEAGDGPPSGQYAVYTLGPSIVQGEKTFANLRWAASGHEVMELCTVRKGDRATPYLPAAHARALAMASDIDGRIENAYVNRAVA